MCCCEQRRRRECTVDRAENRFSAPEIVQHRGDEPFPRPNLYGDFGFRGYPGTVESSRIACSAT